MNLTILGNLQYGQFCGHPIAMSRLLNMSPINCSIAFQSFFISLTCLITFLAALGNLRFTCDHEVPPAQGRLNHSKTGNSLMMLATYPTSRSSISGRITQLRHGTAADLNKQAIRLRTGSGSWFPGTSARRQSLWHWLSRSRPLGTT